MHVPHEQNKKQKTHLQMYQVIVTEIFFTSVSRMWFNIWLYFLFFKQWFGWHSTTQPIRHNPFLKLKPWTGNILLFVICNAIVINASRVTFLQSLRSLFSPPYKAPEFYFRLLFVFIHRSLRKIKRPILSEWQVDSPYICNKSLDT